MIISFRFKYFYLVLISLIFFYSCDNRKDLVVIKNVNFFDGEIYQTNVNIVLDSNIISDITTENDWPENSLVINGEGKTIIPPLLNAHVHVWKQSNLKEALLSGVFALFDMHTTDKDANTMRKYRDSLNYSFYYSSGPGATVPGGHGTQFGISTPTIDSTLSPGKFVNDRINNHADYIKILREPLRPTIDFVQTQEIINECHKHSKLCVAHVSRLADAIRLNDQNVDGLVHIWVDKKINKEQLDNLSKKKLFIVPTLYVNKKLLEYGKTQSWGRYLITFEDLLKETQKVYKSEIPILAGTDAPNFNFNYGDDLITELKLLHQSGIPTIDVLKAATSNIYKSFRIKEFGKLEAGSIANFILINGNPIINFDDISKLEGVWRNGKRIK